MAHLIDLELERAILRRSRLQSRDDTTPGALRRTPHDGAREAAGAPGNLPSLAALHRLRPQTGRSPAGFLRLTADMPNRRTS